MPDVIQFRDRIKEFRRVLAAELKPSPRNWRKHPAKQKAVLEGVLSEIGYADALLVRELPDGSLQLIDGHLRAETTPAQMVPVLILDVDEHEANKLLATLDPLAAMAEADAGQLDALLRDVQTGSEAVAGMLTELAAKAGIVPSMATGAGGDEFDATPEEGPTRVQKGDLWLIGGVHRLLVGDCTIKENVERLMGGEKVGLCFTSPPYAQQRDYGDAAKEKVKDWDALMQGTFACLPMKDDGQVLVNLGLVHREGEWVPYWDGWIQWMREQGWRRFGWYVWDKLHPLPGDANGRLLAQHEWIFHFNRNAVQTLPTVERSVKGGKAWYGLRSKSGEHDKSETERSSSGFRVRGSVVSVAPEDGRYSSEHPAAFPSSFPIAVVECWPGDVYDPFLGSGTTLIAAHRLGRRCYGCEIECRYADVILKRAEAEGLTVDKVT